MENNSNIGRDNVFEIKFFKHSRKLGRILNHEGVIQILLAVKEKPKRHKELFAECGLTNSTFQRGIKELLNEAQLIRKSDTIADNRDTHNYMITPLGNEIINLIIRYERSKSIAKTQQKIIEIENNL